MSEGTPTGDGDESAEAQREKAWLLRRIREVVVPHALLAVLGDGKVKRDGFMDALLATRDTSCFREIRNLLGPLLAKLAEKDHGIEASHRNEIENLLAEISRAGKRVVIDKEFKIDVFDYVTLHVPFDLGGLVPAWAGTRARKGRILMRRLVAITNYSDRKDYVARVAAVFPELGETPPGP